MAACLLLSAYFSATETAFSSANSTRLKTLAEKGNKNAALACRLLGQYDKLLSTILIGNNIVNILMASIGTVLFVRCYGDAGATISTVVVTVVVEIAALPDVVRGYEDIKLGNIELYKTRLRELGVGE